jgi:epoxyqueuosine reductase
MPTSNFESPSHRGQVMDGEALKRGVTQRFAELGFDAVAVTTPAAIAHAAPRLHQFIAAGRHGDMSWMADTAARRADPCTLWPQARTVIVAAMNYGPDEDPMAALDKPDRGVISVYARGRDYHDVIKGRLKQVAGWLHRAADAEVKVFVDTAPLLEKPLAEAAGIGWQGKHTNLVSQRFGSWLFLGSILTTADLPPDDAEDDHCGSCRRCLDVCPTDAFPAPYQLDARRCISYLTIEHKGTIERSLRAAMGNRIFGCDDCLAVCPWNKYAHSGREAKLQARDILRAPQLSDLARLDDSAFRSLFSGSPVKRIGRHRFVRNVTIALGNSGDRAHIPLLEELLGDDSDDVRAMAVWSLGRLCSDAEFDAARARYLDAACAPQVRVEWLYLAPDGLAPERKDSPI